MSADHDTLMRTAQQLIATRMAMLTSMEALRRRLEQRIDTSHGRIARTKERIMLSSRLLQ
jgi:hypothetical protein